MASFELDWRSVAGRAVAPLGVIEHLDIVEDVGACVAARGIDLSAHALALEKLEETLGDGVVVAVASPAHATDQVVLAQEDLPLVAGELTALIGMNHDRRMRLAAP